MADFAIGVDLGGTNLRIAAVDGEGRLIEKVTLGTKVALGRDRVLDDMCDAIRRLRDKYRASSRLLGIGIGVPGIIDMEAGMIRESPNLPGWSHSPVRSQIEERLATRVILENDANCAAFGEKWLGAAREVDDMAMITLGTGVGGGIVLEGHIWHGMNGMAGEFGHTTIEPEGVLCGCGNHGCVEQYASASAIMRMARVAISSGRAPALAKAASSDPEFSARAVYNLAIQGDEDARGIFQQVGRALGILLGNLINSFNLPMYVVGGGVSSAWEAFSPAVFEEIRRRSLVYAATAPASQAGEQGASARVKAKVTRNTIITRALLGSDAGLYGAARLPMTDNRQMSSSRSA
ncbi:MAG: ROK family protein [Acidobacteria bacterium]|nr:ROK family protein [Acidobacteriota bacterium]MBV9484098.1 ROK family protein [Acidobacteriota bacterium]